MTTFSELARIILYESGLETDPRNILLLSDDLALANELMFGENRGLTAVLNAAVRMRQTLVCSDLALDEDLDLEALLVGLTRAERGVRQRLERSVDSVDSEAMFQRIFAIIALADALSFSRTAFVEACRRAVGQSAYAEGVQP